MPPYPPFVNQHAPLAQTSRTLIRPIAALGGQGIVSFARLDALPDARTGLHASRDLGEVTPTEGRLTAFTAPPGARQDELLQLSLLQPPEGIVARRYSPSSCSISGSYCHGKYVPWKTVFGPISWSPERENSGCTVSGQNYMP